VHENLLASLLLSQSVLIAELGVQSMVIVDRILTDGMILVKFN